MKNLTHLLPLLPLLAPCCLFAQQARPFDRLSFHQPPKSLAPDATTSDWPRFLGPTDNGHSPETRLLKPLPPSGPSAVWEVRRGRSHTGPVIHRDRLVFIHELNGRETIECLHPETGQRYWKIEYPVTVGQSYGTTDAPRSSPVIDPASGLVFTLGISSRLQAIELKTGKIAWRTNLTKSLGTAPFFFGRGSGPLVLGEHLVVNAGAAGACVVAFDKLTGEIAWKTPHPWTASYASPITAAIHGQQRLLVFAGGMGDPPSGGLLCIDPKNGHIDDAFPWRSRQFASVIAASPVPAGPNRVFLTEGYGRGGVMLGVDSDRRLSALWTAPGFASQFQTPVYDEGHLYGFSGSSTSGAELVCYDAADGSQQWREGFDALSVPFQNRDLKVQLGRASLLRVDGKFLCLGAQGTLLWLDLSPESAKITSKCQLFHSPETLAPPTLSRGLLYVSQNGPQARLICYDMRQP